MKKILAIILVLCTLCLSSCRIFVGGVAVERFDEHVWIRLDGFVGEKRIEFPHENPNESGIYYSVSITNGSLSVYYDQGWLWEPEKLFDASAGDSFADGGNYVDGNTAKITVILKSDSEVSGEIFIAFEPFESSETQ